MKRASQIRAYLLEQLSGALSRPGMWGTNAYLEQALLARLHDLAFVDDKTASLAGLLEGMRRCHQFLSTGVLGALQFHHLPREDDLTDEVASIYALVAARLGYFKPARRLSRKEWQQLGKVARTCVRTAPLKLADLLERFGPPSYVRLGQTPRVFAFAPPDDSPGWIYFDFHASRNVGDQAGAPHLALRDVRLPAKDFRRAMLHATVSG